MSRQGFSTQLLAELRSEVSHVLVFFHLDFDGGLLRLHTGLGDLVWGGNTWTGIGNIADIPNIEEGPGASPRAITLRASGLDSDILDAAFAEDYINRECILYMGALNTSGGLVADPDEIFRGGIQQMIMTMGGDDGDTIDIVVESELERLNRPGSARYSNAYHQSEQASDEFFEYAALLSSRNPVWRGQTVNVGNPGTVNRDEFTVINDQGFGETLLESI